MTTDQQSLLEEGHRLDELHRSYGGEAKLNESFIVLTVGASLIATLGLLANNAAVVIGAMVVAPWILPLRVAVFALLSGSPRILFRSMATLATGAAITLLLSMGLGWFARDTGLLMVDALPEQVISRLEPTLLDLCIALAAGAIGHLRESESRGSELHGGDGHRRCVGASCLRDGADVGRQRSGRRRGSGSPLCGKPAGDSYQRFDCSGHS